MQLPIIIVIQQQNPDLFFISRLHTQSNYQSLWRKIPLGRLSSCSSVQSARKKISALDFFWCVLIYLSIYFCNCKPTRSHTTAAYIFTYLLTWSPPPFPNRIPGLFLLTLGSVCQRQLLPWWRYRTRTLELSGLSCAKPLAESAAKQLGHKAASQEGMEHTTQEDTTV